MQNITLSGPAAPNTYSPSVPISLYREVAAELQAAQAMLESLKTHNQQLVQQNQQLRREVETVVHAALQLQQAVNSAQAVSQIGMPQMPPVRVNFNPEPPRPNPAPLHISNSIPEPIPAPSSLELPFPFPESEPTAPHLSEKLYTEQPERPYRLRTQPKKGSEISGLWLAAAIFLIVVAAFGAGYWVVRPLLMKR
ncbi:hypothetical protein [Kamptonema sp. UHCC 0994]|uniref:hypothetical protein n=1 Tax=Kamptonema sp. UHCC 0994 TaxID=3031329 RepID=UPI0023BA8EC4|nr:hypothetical protein [Kamptonema sp. UHCC 0994]MDF0556905.1 hypothetical protein [Kamptonema sp. UHCC 0994]